MYRSNRKLISSLILLVLCLVQAFSDEISSDGQAVPPLTKTKLSTIENTFQNASADDYLFSVLQYNDLEPTRQSLVPANDNCFPQNILITIPAAEGITDTNKSHRKTVVFAFTEQFAIECEKQLCVFIKSLKLAKLPYEVIVLLSADDESILSDKEGDYHPGGTATFAEQFDNPDSVCAVVVEQSTNPDKVDFIAGGAGDTAPKWLVHSLRNACLTYGIRPSFSSKFISFYHNDIFRENERVSSFLAKSIPAAGIQFIGSEDDFSILYDTALSLTVTRSDTWDRHYALLQIGKNGVWLSESFFAIFYLLFACISLSLLCFMSFALKRKRIVQSRDVLRMWYLPPTLLLLSSCILFVSELPFSFANSSPVSLFGLKIVITFFFTLIAFILQIRLSYHISINACSFFMLIVSILNIFIFSAINLSLLFIFFFEYLIVLMTNKLQSIPLLVISIILMLFPFSFCIIDLLRYSTAEQLFSLIKCGFGGNVFFAFLLFPFQMQMLRIFITLDLFSKEKLVPIKTVIIRSSIVISISTGVFILFYAIFSWVIIKNKLAVKEKPNFTLVSKNDSPEFTLSIDEQQFLDLTARHLTIASTSPVIRYSVSITTPETVPLYDCNYNYSLYGAHTAYFQLPDYPSSSVEIVYSSDPQFASSIAVSAYIASENDTVYVETRFLETKAGS